jgi:hypothetical protein
MRLILLACVLLFPCLAQAEVQTTFGTMTFGQPPEDGMICVVGPCSSEQLRADIRHNKIDLSDYIKPTDITNYGGWQISSPVYSFFEGRLVRVVFNIQCDKDQAQRCMKEVADALDLEYGLELLENFMMEFDETLSIEAQTYKTGDDTVIYIGFNNSISRANSPTVFIQSHSMMEKMRKSINPDYKPGPLDSK